MESKEQQVISGWSKDRAEYFKELERFLKQHAGASMIEYSNDYRCPTKAYYVFQPYQVQCERDALMFRIEEAGKRAEVEEALSDE